MLKMASYSACISIVMSAVGLNSKIAQTAKYYIISALVDFGFARSFTLAGVCYDAANLIANPRKIWFRKK